MTSTTIKCYVAAAGIAVGLTAAIPGAMAQSAAPAQPPGSAPSNQQTPAQMMAERQKMMADMQAARKKLEELAAQMNSATGTAKIDRIAAVVNELVAQHTRMSTMMQGNMMQMMPNPPRGSAAPASPPSGGKTEPDHTGHHE